MIYLDCKDTHFPCGLFKIKILPPAAVATPGQWGCQSDLNCPLDEREEYSNECQLIFHTPFAVFHVPVRSVDGMPTVQFSGIPVG
jgi:hypothetical protein